MDEISDPSNPSFSLSLDAERIQLSPGATKVIHITFINKQSVEDLFSLSVKGVPIEWLALDQRAIHLGSGEQRTVDVTISIPASSEVRAASFSFQVQSVSQNHPGVVASASAELTVAAYQSQGRVGLLLGHLQYSVAPGGQVVIPILLHNRGLAPDTLNLEVRGLAAGWVKTDDAITHLDPGEQKEISFTIFPPRAAGVGVGPVPFDILIHSQVGPGQPEMVRCTLNIGAFSTFTSWLQPEEITWGNTALLSVKNNGNAPDVFALEWLSPDGSVVFDRVAREPAPPPAGGPEPPVTYTVISASEVLRIQPGQAGSVEFRARPRRLPIIGGDFSLPFSTRVVSSNSKQAVTSAGQLFGKALIPVWVPVSLAILLVVVLCLSLFSYVSSQNLASRAEQTAQAGTLLALAGSQTPTGTSTLTPTPGIPVTGQTATPPTPTFTFTSPPPTATFTQAPPTPTFTILPTTQPPPATFTATFTSIPATATIPSVPSLPGAIVFQSNRDGNQELYAMKGADLSITRLTASSASDSQPALAPDGVRVAYVSNQTGNNEIILTGIDLRTPVNLTNNPADDQSPAWSPDGQWIAFTTNRDGNSEIYIMRADGSQAQDISNNPAEDFSPSWFQTGGLLDRQDWIVFTSNRDGNQEVFIMKPDGSGARNLTNNPANDYSPSGSSDRIVFVSERDGDQEIYTMSVDGSAPVNVTNNPGRDYDPVISPDGIRIAFTSERDGNPEIYIIKPDGTSAFNLTKSSAQDSHPSWR